MQKIRKPADLANIENPTLGDILIALNGGKRQKMFLKKVKKDNEGSVITPFTSIGSKRYRDLTALLFAVARVAGVPRVMEGIVEELDSVADMEY